MRVNYDENGSNLTVRLSGELDHHFATATKDEIDEKLKLENIKNLIFDMEKLSFIDSSGIGFVIGRYKLISKNGGSVEILNASEKVRKILNMSGMEKIIKMN